jgi:hypothetical protein
MLDPQVIVNLLQQRGQQSALRTGRVGCRNVVSSVSHKAFNIDNRFNARVASQK